MNAQEPFITTWKTTYKNESITIPTVSNQVYNYTVDWGDDTADANVTGDATHVYENGGTYSVKITGEFPAIRFSNRNEDRIISIDQWGDIKWSSMSNSFRFCDSLQYNAVDAPDLSNVESLWAMFSGASSFDGDLSNWDVSTIKTMFEMFNGTRMSRDNYDKTLSAWASLPSLQSNVYLGARDLVYCSGEDARTSLINNYGWIIEGDGKICTETTRPFKMQWRIEYENQEIRIPVLGWSDYSVDWGDGTTSSGHNGEATHAYEEVGVYEVQLSGIFPVISFGFRDRESLSKYLLTIDQWGDNKWLGLSFAECYNMTSDAIDKPDLSIIHDLNGVFYGADSFNGNVEEWDVSNAKNMRALFYGASSFSGDLSGWDVSNVTDMSGMFLGAESFNGNIENWDVSNVTDMYLMFYKASSFNRNLANWDVTLVENMREMLNGSSMSFQNYDKTLTGWAKLEGLQKNMVLGAEGLYYCNGDIAHTYLTDNLGWIINDEGQNCRFQRIVFGPLQDIKYDNISFSVEAYSTSGLPLKFNSSNPNVASIENDVLKINGVGNTTILATQEGNSEYDSAVSVYREFTVLKADQIILFDLIPDQMSGENGFKLNAESSSNLTVSYSSDNENIAFIDGDSLVFRGIGSCLITASQGGNENYKSAEDVTRQLVIVFDGITAVGESQIDDLRFFPNPTKEVIYIENFGAAQSLKIYDAEGRLIKSFRLSTNNSQFDFSDQPNGIYFLKVGNKEAFKIIKN